MNEEIILNVETNSPYVIGAVAYVEQLENGAKITIVDKNGTTTATVYDGTDGKSISSITLNDDYTLTILYTDGDTTTTSSIRGATGASGVYCGEEEPIDPAVNVWVDPSGEAYPISEDIAREVDAWLDEHPEATTTVQDGSITTAKLSSDVNGKLNQVDANTTHIANVDALVNNLATLTDGSTTGDAELIAARTVGSTTYQNLHTAIDTEFSNVKSDLSETEIVKDVSFSGAINGQFIATSGNIGSSDSFSYVTNIPVPKGYKIVFTARGYSTTVAMISRYADNKYTPLVESIDSTVRQYEYVATEDMVIALSYNNAHTHSCKLLYEVETQVSAIADSVQKDLTFTYINDYYVYNDGTIISNENFCYTSPVYIEKGVALYVFARGYLSNVAIISKTNSTNTIHTPIVISEDSVAKWYEVDITESGYYCFCSNKIVPIKAYVKIKVGFEDGLEERVDALEENNLFDLSMFINFGVVGDSYASGEVYYDGGFHDKFENSWGQMMARQSGTNCTNYSAGGLTTKTWLTSSDGLPKVLANDAEDIYYLLLGINDRGYYGESYIGTLNDITDYQSYTDYADSFFGNYGRIIEQIQNHAPYAKLVLFTGTNTSELGVKYNNATIAIANYYGIPCIVQNDDAFFQTSYYADMVNGHPRTVAYSGMAQAFKRLIVKCIADNWDYFKDYYMHE